MGRIFRFLLLVVILGLLGLLGYAYLGDLSPDQREITVPVETDAG